MYEILIAPKAERQFRRLPEDIRRRVRDDVLRLAGNPRPNGAEQLEGKPGLWRIRTGDYRIVYTVRDAELVVLVVKIAHRRETYRNLTGR